MGDLVITILIFVGVMAVTAVVFGGWLIASIVGFIVRALTGSPAPVAREMALRRRAGMSSAGQSIRPGQIIAGGVDVRLRCPNECRCNGRQCGRINRLLKGSFQTGQYRRDCDFNRNFADRF